MTGIDVHALVMNLAHEAKVASRVLAAAPTAQKNAVLLRAAERIEGVAAPAILAANAKDLQTAAEMKLSDAMVDRLRLDETRLAGVAEGLRQVAALADPVGSIDGLKRLDNGLQVGRMRSPLGVIGFIYESRPNVTADAAGLCIKSGNAVVLRGGKEAFQSNTVLAEVFGDALEAEGLPRAAAVLIPTTDRAATKALIGLSGLIDLVIPRGGEGLIRFVTENARVPVIQHFKGVCHVYVDGAAELPMALDIAENAKIQRPGVCNAMETLLVDAEVAEAFLPQLVERFGGRVELRGDSRACAFAQMKPASDADWDTEYVDLILSVAVVDGIDGAIAHIAKHGSQHTEAIVTSDYARAQRWLREVDASLVVVNASTRFNDGFQLGLGAEIGISTTKLHAYGPMGLTELCTQKWVAFGEGQIRK